MRFLQSYKDHLARYVWWQGYKFFGVMLGLCLAVLIAPHYMDVAHWSFTRGE